MKNNIMYVWEKYGVNNDKASPEDYDNVVLIGKDSKDKFIRIVKELFFNKPPRVESVNSKESEDSIRYDHIIDIFSNKLKHFVVIFDNYKRVTVELLTINDSMYKLKSKYTSEEVYKLDLQVIEGIILEEDKVKESKIVEIKSNKKETKKDGRKLTTDDINAIIGKNIRYERKKRDLTIDDLSDILNINPGFLGLIERGTRGTNNANLVKISKFFQITLDQLMTKDIPNDELNVLVDSEERLNLIKTVDTYVDSFSDDEIKHFIEVMKSFKRLNSSEMYSEE